MVSLFWPLTDEQFTSPCGESWGGGHCGCDPPKALLRSIIWPPNGKFPPVLLSFPPFSKMFIIWTCICALCIVLRPLNSEKRRSAVGWRLPKLLSRSVLWALEPGGRFVIIRRQQFFCLQNFRLRHDADLRTYTDIGKTIINSTAWLVQDWPSS